MKKSIFLTTLSLLLVQLCFAQLNTNLNISYNPSPKILEWAATPGTVTLMVSNSSMSTVEYKIKATVLRDGNLVAKTNLNALPTQSITAGGVENYYVEDIIPSSAVDILDQSMSNTVLQTGKLPAGNYMFCVELVNPVTLALVSPKQCRPFRITDYQPSRLMLPIDKSKVTQNSALQFSWTPVQPSTLVTYNFRMIELNDGQNAFSAFTENQSFVETEIVGQTTFLYTSDLPVLEEGKSYMWSVQAEDMNGDIVGEDNGFKGWADPFLIEIKANENDDKGKEKEEDKAKQDYVDCNCANDIVVARARLKRFSYDPLKIELREGQTSAARVRKCLNEELEGVSNIVIDSKVYWGDGNSSIVRANGIVEHTYTNTESIPNEVCVEMVAEYTYKRKRLTCKQTYCLPVKDTEYDTQLPSCLDQDLDFAIFNNENLSISVSDRSTINVDNDVTYSTYWDMGDGQLYDNIDSVAHEYDADGLYTITLNYVFQKGEESITCDYLKNKSVSIDCNADVNFTKSKSGYDYTFSSRIELTNGATIDSMNWFINDDHHSRDTAFTIQFNNTRKRDVCLLAYINNADGTKCTVQKCKEVSLEGCAFEECTPDCDAVSSKTYAAEDVIHLCGGLDMEIMGTPTGTASSLTGKGKVYVPWLLTDVAVEFSGIKVSAEEYFCDGEIWAEQHETAPTYPQQWGINAVGGFVIGEPFLKDIETWIYNTSTQVVDLNQQITSQMNPVKVPLGVNNAEGYTLALSSLQFTPNRNKFSAMAIVPVDFYDDHTLGFEATEITFTADGPINPLSPGGSGGLEIIAPKTIYYTTQNSSDNADWFAITFHKKGNGHIGTGFNFTNPCGTAFNWCFRVDADVEMPRKWVTPIPDVGNKVSSNIRSEVCNWEDWLVSIDLPKCELTGSDGFELEVTDFTLDFSSVRNQPGMAFPSNWQGDRTESFKGFWMKQAKLIFPKGFTTFADTTRRLETQLNNWIIHKNNGFTGELLAINIINFPEGNIADLGASIDTLKLNMVNNSFTQAYMRGQVLLPLTDDSPSNAINYKALFGTGSHGSFDGFQFAMEPDGTLQSEFFAGSTLEIFETSYLDLKLLENEKSFDLSLNGSIELPNTITNPINGNEIDVDLTTHFQELGINYRKTSSEKSFNFDAGTWSFASPQKFMANFPVTIENIEFNQLQASGNQLLHGKLNFDVLFNLSKDIGAKSTFGIKAEIKENNAASGLSKFQPKYVGFSVDEIHVRAHLPAVSIDGTISLRQNDPVFGNGFKGVLSATFKTPKIAVDALAEFGNTTYENNNIAYRYGRVEVKTLFEPGLPFLTGLAFYGFGGGYYQNMNPEIIYSSTLGKDAYTFKPKHGTSGFKVLATIGTTPKVETFNADVDLSGRFSASQGLVSIGFNGQFYIGAPLMPESQRNKAQILGDFGATYNFPTKHFYSFANVMINKPPAISTPSPVNLTIDINGKDNLWFLKIGEPTNTNTVNVFGTSVSQYFGIGNNINAPQNGFTDGFRNKYRSILGNYPGIPSAPGVNSNSATGKGIALGLGIAYDNEIDFNIKNNYYFNMGLDIGAEINLSMMEYNGQNCANTSQRVGLNGWRARGSIGFYVDALAQIQKRNNGNIVNTWDILDLKAGGWLDAQFPRPTYATGAIQGSVKMIKLPRTKVHFLGDCSRCGGNQAYHLQHPRRHTGCVHYNPQNYLINTSVNKSFEVGDNCGSSNNSQIANNSAPVAEEDAAKNQEDLLIRYVHPDSRYNFPETMPISVSYGLPLEEEFDVSEQQSNGSIVNRTFKLEREVKLYLKNESSGIFELVSHSEEKNNMGEYLYIFRDDFSSPNADLLNVRETEHVAFASARTSLVNMARDNTATVSEVYYPPTPPNNEYDNLPPAPAPVTNSLLANRDYKIVVTANLMEFTASNWISAKKRDGASVIQEITKQFRTGAMVAETHNARQIEFVPMQRSR